MSAHTHGAADRRGRCDAWNADDQIASLQGNTELTVETVPGDGVITMSFNSSSPSLADAEVRRALWQGVNFEEIVASLFPRRAVQPTRR